MEILTPSQIRRKGTGFSIITLDEALRDGAEAQRLTTNIRETLHDCKFTTEERELELAYRSLQLDYRQLLQLQQKYPATYVNGMIEELQLEANRSLGPNIYTRVFN